MVNDVFHEGGGESSSGKPSNKLETRETRRNTQLKAAANLETCCIAFPLPNETKDSAVRNCFVIQGQSKRAGHG